MIRPVKPAGTTTTLLYFVGISCMVGLAILIILFNTEPLLVADQWGLYTPLLKGASLVTGFFYQHGSHFLGVSYLLSRVLQFLGLAGPLGEGFLVLGLMALNIYLSLRIKYRLTGTLHWWDALLIALFLYPGLAEIYLWSAHSAVVALPLMSVLLSAHFLLQKSFAKRVLGLSLVGIFSIFTGYAFLVSFQILLYFLFQIPRKKEKRDKRIILAGLLSQLAAIALAVKLYQFPPIAGMGTGNELAEYPIYGIYLLMGFLRQSQIWPGLAWLLTTIIPPLVWLLVFRTRLHAQAFKIPLWLIAFSGIYFLLNTYSRAGIGVSGAFAARYTYFLWPGFLGIYLVLTIWPAKERLKIIPILFLLGSPLISRLTVLPEHFRSVKNYHAQVKDWLECYQRTRDPSACYDPDQPGPFISSQKDKAVWFLVHWSKRQKTQITPAPLPPPASARP